MSLTEPEGKLHSFELVQDTAWAITRAKMDEINALVERRLHGEQMEFPAALQGKSGNRADEGYQVRNGVAVLPVYGVLAKRMNLVTEMSGGTSMQLLARDLKKALADPKVRSILLDVESPGGTVDGTQDLANLVLAARDSKPVVAYANGQMASAAYWIGSAASIIVAGETAQVGSIGVIAMHYDRSEQDQKLGVKRTAIYAGKFKRAGGDEQPLSAEDREYLQERVDDYYTLFLNSVAENRRVDAETAQKKMADGRIFVGKKALKAGLIDQIGNFDDALALARAKGGSMSQTREKLQAESPELFQALLAEGAASVTLESLLAQDPGAADKLRAEGREAGVKLERERAAEILEAAGVTGLIFEGVQKGLEVKDALKSFLAHQDQVKTEALGALVSQAPPPVGTEPLKVETHNEPPDNAPIETRAKAEWDKDATLQAEFGGKFETYLAYKRADEAGLAKQITKG